MKRVILFSFCLGALNLLSADVPIIFLHGNKAEAVPIDTVWKNGEIKEFKGGLLTWYPLDSTGSLDYPTAMTKIIGYQGYDWGVKDDGSPAIDCDINTELMPDQGTKRVFNFSYYSPDGSPGVIGLNKSENRLETKENFPLWKRLIYSVEYSVGVCYRGKDFLPYCGELFCYEPPIYLLHSMGFGTIYHLRDREGIEVEIGGSYAKMHYDEDTYWDFRNLQGIIDYLFIEESWTFGIGLQGYYSWVRRADKVYEDTDGNPYTPGIFVGWEFIPGKGKGVSLFFKTYRNVWRYCKIGIIATFGRINVEMVEGRDRSLEVIGLHVVIKLSNKGGV